MGLYLRIVVCNASGDSRNFFDKKPKQHFIFKSENKNVTLQRFKI